jgi:hypothetical protein
MMRQQFFAVTLRSAPLRASRRATAQNIHPSRLAVKNGEHLRMTNAR